MYFEQIMPQAHGPAHQSHKCFCFGCSDTSSNKVVQDEKNGNDVEMVAAAKENDEGKIYMGISVRNLVMEFKVNKETKEAKEAKEAKGAKGAKEEGETKEATKGKAAATKKLRAVDDLCVDFPQGSITAVLGHNGAGENDLDSLHYRIVDPDLGFGHDQWTRCPVLRRQHGMASCQCGRLPTTRCAVRRIVGT